MKKSTSRWLWLLPAVFAAILFVGQVATNLIVKYVDPYVGPYTVSIVCVVALIAAVVAAIMGTRRDDPPQLTNSNVSATAERSVAIGGDFESGTINTGDTTVRGNEIGGRDRFTGDKNIYITYAANAASPAVNSVNPLHQLRAPVRDFVGREQEITTLVAALRGGSHVGINGMGGIGKTELALLIAERVAGAYPDAQFVINLQGADASPRRPEEVLAMCIRAFIGAEAALPDDRDQLMQRYRSALNSKRVLVLLDNAADSEQIQSMLPPPGSVVLVTSRQAVSLPGIERLKLNPLTTEEARRLLLEIAPHADSAADQICEFCGYLPLAIRAAGSLLAVTEDLDPVAYAAQLKDERNRLERIGKEGVERDVAASFHLSFERLSPGAARVFRLLSVFPGTFHAFSEEHVCDDPGHAQLSNLVRRSLVIYDESTKRYRLHDLARLFANSKLSEEERASGHKHHATHYKEVLAAADALYLKGGEAFIRGLTLFDLEWHNIQTGHTWVEAQGVEAHEDMAHLAMAYPDVGAYILYLRLHAREWIRWLEVGLKASRLLKNRMSEGNRLGNLGLAHSELGDTERAIDFYEQSLLIARELGDRKGEAITLGNLGTAYEDLGETEKAIQFYQQQLRIVRQIGYRRGEANALGNLGVAYMNLGEIQRAIEFCEKAMLIDREVGDRRGEGIDTGNIGIAYAQLGETEQSIQFFEQQLSVVREIGDRRGEGNALWNISLSLAKVGRRAQAIQCAEQALIIKEQIEDPDTLKVHAALAVWRVETNTS